MPEPRGAALERTARLGLGTHGAAMQALHGGALVAWRAEVGMRGDGARLTFPVPAGHAGRGFGFTRHGGLGHVPHEGLDIGAPEGTLVVASRAGLVVYSDNGIRGMGNVVVLAHEDGSSTLYAHCRRTLVATGEQVQRGQAVGEVGATGLALGPHLHFEWHVRGAARNPASHFVRRDSDPALAGHPVRRETR